MMRAGPKPRGSEAFQLSSWLYRARPAELAGSLWSVRLDLTEYLS